MKLKRDVSKKYIMSALLLLMLMVIIVFTVKSYADTIIGGTTGQIADEKTIIRTAVAVSRGKSSSDVVEIDTLTTELGRYASATVASISSEIIEVTFNKTGNIYEINVNTGPTFDSPGETIPYLPLGYTPVENTDLESGFVIEDENGNQFVWVEVPRTEAVYPTAGLDIKNFTTEEFELIEADLHTYTSAYGEDGYVDEWSSEAATGLTSEEYNELKKKMLKSVYKNGGFYVGRYETGIDYSQSARTAAGATTQVPVIKQNAYPYNWVTNAQSQELSSSFKTTGYETSLMFGVQWDLVLKYLETSGAATETELNTDSKEIGNYLDAIYSITNTNAKYLLHGQTSWGAVPYTHNNGDTTILTTGASNIFNKQNIYDLAGNVEEWTIEHNGRTDFPCIVRGGYYYRKGSVTPADKHGYFANTISDTSVGFRVALYKDEGTYTPDENNQPPYIPNGYTAIDGTMDTGFVIADSLGNEYVWVEVPQTVAVYQTAGLSVTAFTEEEFEQIENDLHTYTSVYRNGTTFTDTWNSEQTTGLTQTEYNTKKKKMLKSIYVNGGFYVGRYETGTATARNASSDALTTAEIKRNIHPYDWVSISRAQELSESFATTGYETSLMFGVQWDLVMKYLETSGAATQAELLTDSTNIGNYKNSTYNITNISAKYQDTNSSLTWFSAPYNKTDTTKTIYLTTGANSNFYKQNISDLAGNSWEFTLEKGDSNTTVVSRSGGMYWRGNETKAQAAGRNGSVSVTYFDKTIGFRTCLYKDEGTSTYDAPTYIPYGYAHVAGTDMETGFVIEDELGNQYVWVEVPKTASVYQTAGTGIALFTDSEFEAIETDLQTYTSTYRASGYTDTWYSLEATGLTESEYYIQKKKMLKSIYKNGGFYVGRYETGIDYSEGARTSSTGITQTPVIKQNAYPYTLVVSSQAQELSESFETTGYETSLMFGVQWDLIMKYLEVSGATTQDELITDSKSWGNYGGSTYEIVNTNAKYSTDYETWTSAPFSKGTDTHALLTTGASDVFAKQNIYDLAGNAWELTLEKYASTSNPRTARGGWESYGSSASLRSPSAITTAPRNGSFRVSLYKDEGIGITAAYIPEGYTQVSGTTIDNGLTVQDASGNQYVWVKVPRTVTVYPTAGLNIESFTDTEYAAIEEDLQTYIGAYQGGYDDAWTSEEAMGLTEGEYYALKKNMLKSVYINGGFYVGRYETGIAYSQSPRTAKGETTQTPVIQQNAYAYNYVTLAQAHSLSSSFATTGYQTNLIFGMQWNLIMKYLETSGAVTSDGLLGDSKSWGNYYDSLYNITNTSAKYSTNSGSSYSSAPYNKTTSAQRLLTTGASDIFSKQNIYDLAGNIGEWNFGGSGTLSGWRGSYFAWGGTNSYPDYDYAHMAMGATSTSGYSNVGFRTTLFKDEGVSLKRSYDASNLDGNGTTGTSTTTIKDLSGNYDGTIYNSPTFGEGYIALNQGSTTGQYIDLGQVVDKSKVTVNLKFSISELTGESQYLIGNWENGGFGIGINAEGKVFFSVYTESATNHKYQYSTNAIEVDTIYDVTGIYDGKYMYLYVDGALQSTLETTGGNIKNPGNNTHLVIGGNPAGAAVSTSGYGKMKLYKAKVYTAP